MRLLLDENVSLFFRDAVLRILPDLVVTAVGNPDAPPKSTPDPEILIWCEQRQYLLFTNNRRSMPIHLRDHLREGRSIPGILVFNRDAPLSLVLDHLEIILEASLPDELVDQIHYLPFPWQSP